MNEHELLYSGFQDQTLAKDEELFKNVGETKDQVLYYFN